jgi:hypothetical protein
MILSFTTFSCFIFCSDPPSRLDRSSWPMPIRGFLPALAGLLSVVAGSSHIRWCESNDLGCGIRAVRAVPPPNLYQALRLVPPPRPPRPGLRLARRGPTRQGRSKFYRLVGQRSDYHAQWFENWQEEKIQPRAGLAQRAAGDETQRQQASVEGLRVYVLVQRPGCHSLALSMNVRACVRKADRPTLVVAVHSSIITLDAMPITRVYSTLEKTRASVLPAAGQGCGAMRTSTTTRTVCTASCLSACRSVGRRLEEEKVLEGMGASLEAFARARGNRVRAYVRAKAHRLRSNRKI